MVNTWQRHRSASCCKLSPGNSRTPSSAPKKERRVCGKRAPAAPCPPSPDSHSPARRRHAGRRGPPPPARTPTRASASGTPAPRRHCPSPSPQRSRLSPPPARSASVQHTRFLSPPHGAPARRQLPRAPAPAAGSLRPGRRQTAGGRGRPALGHRL